MNIYHLSKQIVFGITAMLIFLACDTAKDQPPTRTPQASTATAEQDTTEQEFKTAPDFTLETMNGDSFTLSEQEGKVVVLNFWATWCAPCRKEIPDFMELQEELRDDEVLFVGISLDKEGWSKVRPYAKKMGINYPIMVANQKINRNYGPIRAVPTTLILNKKRQVEYVAPGMLTKERLKPILKKLAQR